MDEGILFHILKIKREERMKMLVNSCIKTLDKRVMSAVKGLVLRSGSRDGGMQLEKADSMKTAI